MRGWISNVPTLRLGGLCPTPEALVERLSKFWLPDEPVLYIGKAGTSVKKRVGQFYRTPLGKSKPHAGGHWLKTLSVLKRLSVFWAVTKRPEYHEGVLIKTFVRNVSEYTKLSLYDPERPFPFANLEYPKGNKKEHGITGAVNRRTRGFRGRGIGEKD